MIRIHFVGDGPRDGATVPHLVQKILGLDVDPSTNHWARLNAGGQGYSRKVLFAILQAIDAGAAGLVAVVDRDKDDAWSRLRKLQEGRELHRQKRPPFPTALGEAVPHGEAWLMGDPIAIKEALDLKDDVAIPSLRRIKDPKGDLNRLIEISKHGRETDRMIVLGHIARLVDPERCMHIEETGFARFAVDVLSEFAQFRQVPGS
jgi:hypothetical protein